MIVVVLLLLAGGLTAAVPPPHSHFGHPIGADRTSLEWAKVVEYFYLLAKNSDRIKVSEYGRTTEGRPMIAAWISAPETIRSLDRFQEIQKRLADPRRTPEPEAEKLIAEGKAVVMITCSIHSTEVASTHTAVEFAYRMLTDDGPKTRAILANTIFILVPSLNPDGVDLVTNWYRKTLGTPYEGTSPPELYQKYVGHDNNRDWYIFSQVETRNTISRLHNVWHPQVVYDVHQQGPNGSRMFVPPWLDPIDPNVDPILMQLSNMIGMSMALDLTAAGKTGVAVNAMYDFWTPARHYQAYHGGARILSESASARLSSPITVTLDQISSEAPGFNPRQPSWNYLEPWLGGVWRLRDIIDYQLIAMESCLYTAAVRRQDLLRAFYRVGKRAVERSEPYAFVVPAEQQDPGSAEKLLSTLAFGLVEIERAGRPFEADGRKFSAGSYVIRMQQPYSAFAKTLLERQKYPDLRMYPGGPPKRPYDVTAHTLPLLMGVEVAAIEKPFRASLTRAASFSFPRPNGLTRSDIEWWRKENRKKSSRIGLYRSWVPSMDEGWTRWLLDEFGFEYTSLRNAEIIAGGLSRKYDVIVFPDQPPGTIYHGYRPGTMPDEYVGGLGSKGEQELRRYAEEGGRLVFINRSCDFATGHLGVGAKNIVRDLPNREFYVPGSLLNVTLDRKHPLAAGLPEKIAIWVESSPAFEAPEGASVVARYNASNLLASGWLLGEKYLVNRAALLDIPVGKGRVILFGFRPQYRAQSYQTFKLFFNALTSGVE